MIEILASGLYLEGLAVDGDTVWYSDVIAGGVHRYSPVEPHSVVMSDRKWIGGVHFAADGSIVATGRGGTMLAGAYATNGIPMLDSINGVPINGINEIAPDNEGGYYFGGCDLDAIVSAKRPSVVSLYHVSANGGVRELCGGLRFTNGMALSDDGRRLYCNESFDGTYVHDVGSDGALSNRRLLLAKPDCDGLALDVEGNAWITGFASSFIERVRPDGSLLDRLQTPAGAITQCRFGGPDMRTLYLATVPADAGQKLAAGDLPASESSYLMRVRVEVAGRKIPKIAIPTSVRTRKEASSFDRT